MQPGVPVEFCSHRGPGHRGLSLNPQHVGTEARPRSKGRPHHRRKATGALMQPPRLIAQPRAQRVADDTWGAHVQGARRCREAKAYHPRAPSGGGWPGWSEASGGGCGVSAVRTARFWSAPSHQVTPRGSANPTPHLLSAPFILAKNEKSWKHQENEVNLRH